MDPPHPGWEEVKQGTSWTAKRRNEFYYRDQGSRIMPLSWIMALKLPDGRRFMDGSLKRYGYLPNDDSNVKIPIGFTVTGKRGEEEIGMTCAACHTRQIEVAGKAYRIDGGPAIVDFQTLLSDLDTAVGAVVRDTGRFADFARAVLGDPRVTNDESKLRQDLSYWYQRYHTLMDKSLPQHPWGPGRLDAIGMIFNRIAGLDLGPEPYFILEKNIERAEAPVRYPFLWNVQHERVTQWPGIAPNQLSILRLVRNVGQVLGVFGDFHPKKDENAIFGLGVDYKTGNSVNVDSTETLETLVTYIGAPRWPWAIDEPLAKKGEDIYKEQCDYCHKAKPPPWPTKILDVNTDFRELELVKRTAETGELEGAKIWPVDGPLGKTDAVRSILALSAVGTIIQKKFGRLSPEQFRDLNRNDLFRNDVSGYEARVLHGVWAAAPYLHNGSVPTLRELLKPPSERTPTFAIGSAYDPVNVGLAVDQPQFDAVVTTTGCDDRGSGNSRCGHKYGTMLSKPDKEALLEYLKKL